MKVFTRIFLLLYLSMAGLHEAGAQSSVTMMNVREQNAKDVNIISPVAAEFGKYVVNPVGYYTGIPQISVPLYTIKLKDFELPIALNYHSGGIKVEETASNVGLGWSLAAGGVITRAVKDKADDLDRYHCRELWAVYDGVSEPAVDDDGSKCANGLLWALETPATSNFDGIDSYDIDLGSFNGLPGSTTPKYSMKLLKMFYGVAQFSDQKDIYLLSMVDKEPDIFYFNFAGRTGQFVFDVSTGVPQIRMFPYQDLKIEYTTDSNKRLSEFKITDEQGVVFLFTAVEETWHITGVNSAPVDDEYIDGSGLINHVRYYDTGAGWKRFNSSWFLSRIETPLGEYLDFSYADEEYTIASRGPQQTGLHYIRPLAGALNYDPNDIGTYGYYNSLNRNDMTIYAKRLTAIENDNIRLDFGATIQRDDLVPGWKKQYTGGIDSPIDYILVYNGAYAIDEVLVQNKIGGTERIKKFKLEYDYFTSSLSETINPLGGGAYSDRYEILLEDSAKYYKRLRLKSVQEFGKDDNNSVPAYKFEYKYFDYTGNSAHILPHRLSFQQDMWGYYNGASGNKTLIPSLYVYPSHYPVKDSRQFSVYQKNSYVGSEYLMPGADRLPNVNAADIGILTKIVYPTQGYTAYEFEPHIFREEGQDYSGGGLRIKRITKSDGDGVSNSIVYNYAYVNADNTSSGSIVSKPIFASRSTNLNWGITDNNSEEAYKSQTTRYSAPQAVMGNTNGSFVGYRTVTEFITGNGKKVLTYSMPATWHVDNDIPITTTNGICDPAIDGHCDGLYAQTQVVDIFISSFSSNLSAVNYDFSQNPATPNTLPFPDNPNYDWQRGHLLSEKYFADNGTLLKETLYQYANYFPANRTEPTNIYGYKMSHHYPVLNSGYFPTGWIFRASKYKIITDVAKVLKYKKEVAYDDTDPLKGIASEITYKYESPYHNNVTQTVTMDSKERVVKDIMEYPEDLSNDELGSDLLKANHMHSKMLRQKTLIDDAPVGKTEVKYESRNGMAVPVYLVDYADGVNQSSKQGYDYDAAGNVNKVVQVVKENADGTIAVPGVTISHIWGYNNSLLIGKVENAASDNIFYTGFEDGDGNSNDSRTGHKSRTGGYNKVLSNLINGSYILTYWTKSGTSWALQTNNVTVTAGSYSISIGSSEKVDDIRFYPSVAKMTTITHDPLVGTTSITDENNITMYYEYDVLGRLKFVKDRNYKILKRYEYNYKR